jgi:mevalonate kinase
VLGGYLSYTLEEKAKPLPFQLSLPVVIGDTLIEHRTNEVNTHIRKWLSESPSRMHVFQDMGYLLGHFMHALETNDFKSLGHIMNLHQLLQEKMGTGTPETDRLIEAAIAAGAMGVKISGSGGGGIVIALVQPDKQAEVAAAMDAAGGKSYVVSAGVQGTRLETPEVWEAAIRQRIY